MSTPVFAWGLPPAPSSVQTRGPSPTLKTPNPHHPSSLPSSCRLPPVWSPAVCFPSDRQRKTERYSERQSETERNRDRWERWVGSCRAPGRRASGRRAPALQAVALQRQDAALQRQRQDGELRAVALQRQDGAALQDVALRGAALRDDALRPNFSSAAVGRRRWPRSTSSGRRSSASSPGRRTPARGP